ncbi:serine protease 27 [Platysternon megacephalum]|uniref:Serine protease 27 n=1 Tax=Platysternon megacephalum TaxID=55544 RepID=A0A4D9DP58_9SAUR|nr:serine protease 27 [Platysternon megacephalum]
MNFVSVLFAKKKPILFFGSGAKEYPGISVNSPAKASSKCFLFTYRLCSHAVATIAVRMEQSYKPSPQNRGKFPVIDGNWSSWKREGKEASLNTLGQELSPPHNSFLARHHLFYHTVQLQGILTSQHKMMRAQREE